MRTRRLPILPSTLVAASLLLASGVDARAESRLRASQFLLNSRPKIELCGKAPRKSNVRRYLDLRSGLRYQRSLSLGERNVVLRFRGPIHKDRLGLQFQVRF